MHRYLCSVAVLLALLYPSTCSMYCITPTQSTESESNDGPCLTFTQFANSSRNLQPSTTLILQPGNYTLDVCIPIFNIPEFSMLGNDSTATPSNFTILCESNAKFTFESVNSVFIYGLSFVGCGDNTFSRVDQLTINNTIFSGTEESSTAIVLKQTTTTIINSAFLSNRNGRLENQTFTRVGGAVVATLNSTVSVHGSSFRNNSAEYGGAIYAELGSTVMLNDCHFSGNLALSNGDCIHASTSIVYISDSTFSNNGGGTGSRAIFLNDSSTTFISTTNFTNNFEVILSVLGEIMIVDCDFNSNQVPENTVFTGVNNSLLELLSINYRGILLVVGAKIILTDSSFHDNEATESGGILVLNNSTLITSGKIVLEDNKAFEGCVTMIGSTASFNGAIEFKNNLGALSALMSRVEFAATTLFSNNTPSTRDNDFIRGGAVTIYFGELRFTGPNTTLTGNQAIIGGALYAVESNVYITTETAITNNTAQRIGGGVYLYQTSLLISASTDISRNCAVDGGGMYVLSASVIVTSSSKSTFHSLAITDNTATLGGGLFFSSNAHIYIYQLDPRRHSLTTTLANNDGVYGGAIYVRDEANLATCEGSQSTEGSVSSDCFFQVVDLFEQTGTLELYFESNSASTSGPILFGGLLDRCNVNQLTNSSFFDTDLRSSLSQINGMSYLLGVSNLKSADNVTSLPVRVCFCFEGQPNCSVKQRSVRGQRGRNFTVSVIALDHVGHALNATVFSTLQSQTGGLGEGLQSQTVDERCTDLTFSVVSSEDHEQITIYANGPCGSAGQSSRTINVTFSECLCPIGFDINPLQTSTCECVCSESIADYVSNCTVETETFTKTDSVWIGYTNTASSNGFIISHSCPYDYCHPPGSVLIDLNVPNGADSQCADNRAGDVCGGCAHGYSLSSGRSGCVKCSGVWPLNALFLTLATLISGILLVIVILFLNLTVAVGTINGFIFTANILQPIFPFPHENSQTFLISHFNLNIGLNVCFYDGYSSYARTWLLLLFPLYLIFIVVMVIVISECSPRFARFIGKRNPVETLATLIFFSYASILQFTIFALSYGILEYPNGVYERVWLPDASVIYYDIRHSFMFIAAVVVLAVVLIYTLLLFSWQWLVRLSNKKVFAVLRNTKLQSFIEMYHVPHSAKHRYWTGLLLLMRMIVNLVAVLTSSSDPTATHFAVVTVLTALLVIKSLSALRVYKKWPVDILETVLIANAFMLSASSWYASNTNNHRILIAVVSTSTIIMVSLLIGVILYHVNHYVFDIQKRLTNISLKVCHRFQATSAGNNNDVESQDQPSEFPENLVPLNVDRYHSILAVMDSPTTSDYHQVRDQESEMSTEGVEDDRQPVPVQPTFSILQFPNYSLSTSQHLQRQAQEQQQDTITEECD